MVKIRDGDELQNWLEDKPVDWAQAITIRTALRVAPFAVLGSTPAIAYDATILWGLAVSWATLRWPAEDISSNEYVFVSTDRTTRTDYPDAVFAIDLAATATDVPHEAFNVMVEAVEAASYAAADDLSIWEAASGDCLSLLNEHDWRSGARKLIASQGLWESEPDWFLKSVEQWSEDASLKAQGFDIWLEWYRRRLRGDPSSFGLPPDLDKELTIRIVTQDRAWWERPAREVNADIKAWLDEARAQAALEQNADALEPEPQSRLAIQWVTDANGIVDLKPGQGIEELDRSQEAIDRHAEARDAADRLVQVCNGANGAGVLVEAAVRYLAALGDKLDDMRLGLLFQRGERLRQTLRQYEEAPPETLLLETVVALRTALSAAVSAHNIMVALDPALDRRDRAMLGPDGAAVLAVGPAATAAIEDAAAFGIVTPEALDALREINGQVPQVPTADNRLVRRASESLKNLGRVVAAFIHAHRKELIIGTITILPQMVYNVLSWFVRQIAWLRAEFADRPAMLGLIEQIFAILSKLPLN
jgi:hypothetical protein